MQKVKTSQKSMKESNLIVLGVGYCDLQDILQYETPTAYATRAEGWACDLYHINDRYSIVTGYSYDRASTDKAHKHPALNQALQKIERVADQWNKEERMTALISVLDEHFASKEADL